MRQPGVAGRCLHRGGPHAIPTHGTMARRRRVRSCRNPLPWPRQVGRTSGGACCVRLRKSVGDARRGRFRRRLSDARCARFRRSVSDGRCDRLRKSISVAGCDGLRKSVGEACCGGLRNSVGDARLGTLRQRFGSSRLGSFHASYGDTRGVEWRTTLVARLGGHVVDRLALGAGLEMQRENRSRCRTWRPRG